MIIEIVISRAATKCRASNRAWTRVLGLYDIVTAFWHAEMPDNEPLRIVPPRGEEATGRAWHMRKAMYCTEKPCNAKRC